MYFAKWDVGSTLSIRMPVYVSFQADVRQSMREESFRSTELEAEHPRFLVIDTVFGRIWTTLVRSSGEEKNIFATKTLVHLK